MSHIYLNTPISKLLKQNSFKVTFSETEVEEYIVPIDEFAVALNDVKERLAFKLKGGFVSSILLQQLARHTLQIYEKFGDEIHQYHVPSILDILECHENKHKVNIRPFKKLPLKGLEHIHHNSRTFTATNIELVWKAKIKGKDEIVFQNELLNEIYTELRKEYDENTAKQKSLTVLLVRIHNESIFRKIEKQTGEWIVCTSLGEVNYYLCLATHNESKKYGDQVVFDRIKPCFEEFPELKNINSLTQMPNAT